MISFENPKDAAMAEFLKAAAQDLNPSPDFKAGLEERLRAAHRPKPGLTFSMRRNVLPALGWSVGLIVLASALIWAIRSLSANSTPRIGNGFSCPVTEPNGSLPPGETVESEDYLGNDQLWTTLWPDGKVYMFPENQEADGSFSMKWPWWRGVTGPLTIEGHRLDAEAEPLRAEIPEGYGDTGFQASALIFPAAGCWEVTGRVGNASLTFVTEVFFDIPTPTPGALIDDEATPIANNEGYDWRGAKLYLAQPLPESPAEAGVYLLKEDQPATVDEARVLAERFGIEGEIYTRAGQLPETTEYVVTDGKKLLSVRSNGYFSYTADIVKSNRSFGGTSTPNAEEIIGQFLKSHGFDLPFSISAMELRGRYIVQQLAPDGIPMQYEFYSPPTMRVTLDENGDVLSLEASLMNYDQNAIGSYGIITAEDALQKMLDINVQAGKIESMSSSGHQPPQEWYREYPDNQAITIYGHVTSYPAADSSKPPLVLIDGRAATGNINGLDALEYYTFIEATGQYVTENGIRKFNVEAWNTNVTQAYEAYITGTLHREEGQIILTSDDGSGQQYPLVDAPADVPLDTKIPDSQLAVSGVIVNGNMSWTYIQYFDDMKSMGGGGGGGGLGFYKLNLNGTPVPFPTPTQSPTPNSGDYIVQEGDTLSSIAYTHNITVEELMQANGLTDTNIFVDQMLIIPGAQAPTEQKVEDLRGFLSITIHKKADGSQTTEYSLTGMDADDTFFSFPLEGSTLTELDAYNALPLLITGTARTTNGMTTINVESYKIPFPDLRFQIVKGTQKAEEIDGQTVVIFTTEDAKSYVEFMANTNQPASSFIGIQGDLIQQEVLSVPDETFGGMPVIHVYQSSIIDDNAPPMQATTNQPYVIDDTSIPEIPNYTPPNLTIEKVELVYFVSNPQYQTNDPSAGDREPYIQPVWHFYGHYSNGDEFDILIQALKEEFLLPELAPYIRGG